MHNKFDFDGFKKEKYERRTGTAILKSFGDSKETVEWLCQNLDSVDISFVAEAARKNTELKKAKKNNTLEIINILSEYLGFDGDKPNEIVQRYVMFERGSVDLPENWKRPDTVKFAFVHPMEFQQIIDKINELTGMGAVKKKQMNSGKKESSKTT